MEQSTSQQTYDIDMVYLWVNGNDPKWIAKHDAMTGRSAKPTDANCTGRYADNDELKYSLRSIEKYAPWIRKIFIVTDQQVPSWLDTSNPRVRIVDHTEIMPPECLPCFNSTIIEHFIHRIPGLADKYLYGNDDTLLNKPVTPDMFYGPDGLPIIRFNRRPLWKLTMFFKEKVLRRKLNNYVLITRNAAELVKKHYGTYFTGKAHHNIDAFLKSNIENINREFQEEIKPTLTHHLRSDDDIHRHLYSYASIAQGRAHLRYVDQHTSFHFHIDRKRHYRKFARLDPIFFCMNDSQYATDADRKASSEFLSRMFPEKSQFEL